MKEVRGEMPDVGDERKVAITNSAWVEVSRRMQEEGIKERQGLDGEKNAIEYGSVNIKKKCSW